MKTKIAALIVLPAIFLVGCGSDGPEYVSPNGESQSTHDGKTYIQQKEVEIPNNTNDYYYIIEDDGLKCLVIEGRGPSCVSTEVPPQIDLSTLPYPTETPTP